MFTVKLQRKTVPTSRAMSRSALVEILDALYDSLSLFASVRSMSVPKIFFFNPRLVRPLRLSQLFPTFEKCPTARAHDSPVTSIPSMGLKGESMITCLTDSKANRSRLSYSVNQLFGQPPHLLLQKGQ